MAIDIMVFAGVATDKAAEAERAGGQQAHGLDEHVSAPVQTVLSRLSRFRRRHPQRSWLPPAGGVGAAGMRDGRLTAHRGSLTEEGGVGV
ncbi:hypothetical protein [Streptomyces laculatispora]|uniref:hypothetical protein n=1 Tax=Streptomyces laculatispora TaxID=887464 RepID=UPI001A93CB2F|nr:hypothetical protein [Streptomyces laculatispora]MBO0913720.1 hypothetical protein [Streptomyces laculatispora]